MLQWLFLFGFFWASSAVVPAGSAQHFAALCDSFAAEMLLRNPDLATHLGIRGADPQASELGQLTDVSLEAEDELYCFLHEFQDRFQDCDQTGLTRPQRIDREVLLWFLAEELSGERFRHHDYILDPMFGFQNRLMMLLTSQHRICSRQDAEAYLTRLAVLPERLEQIAERVTLKMERGLLPPRVIVARTRTAIENFLQLEPRDNVLYRSYVHRLRDVPDVDRRARGTLQQACVGILATEIYPAYRSLLAIIAQAEESAREEPGVWAMPEGQAYYRHCLRRHTTTQMSPGEIHRLGLAEVARIQRAALGILDSMGIARAETYGETMQRYWDWTRRQTGERFHYAAETTSRAQVLDDFKAILLEIETQLPALFANLPTTPLQVKAIPPDREATMVAHYARPSLDGRRPGTFYVNLAQLPAKPGMRTLALHEGIPGHHFQFALQQETGDVQLFRHMLHFTGYVEGWALYAERLGVENGWYRDDHELLAYLNSELLRSARLVLDTGLHALSWTRREAFDYMITNLGWGSYASIDRYTALPGQACAYKLGELRILRLREEARAALGERFEIQEFHRAVLQPGAVPLDVLEQCVETYLTESSPR